VSMRVLLKLFRPHQWSKNILILLPLVASHEVSEWPLLRAALTACLAFCFIASGVYAFNDAVDAESDRQHKTKKYRPVASGEISVQQAFGLSFFLICAGLATAAAINFAVLVCVVTYVLANLLYTQVLKRVLMLDVLCLTGFYLLRIATGHAATAVEYSPWLLAFVLFLFFSLALMKRSSELVGLIEMEKLDVAGRGYRTGDLQALNSFGISSGMLSVLVLALYIDRGSDTHGHYAQPWILWFLCPLVLYWLTRAWLLTGRGEMHDDPVLFAILDRASQVTTGVAVGIFILASKGLPF